MKKAILILAVLVLGAGLAVGCPTPTSDGDADNVINYKNQEVQASDFPIWKPILLDVEWVSVTYTPVILPIGNMVAGGIVDTWTVDGQLEIEGRLIAYKEGEPLFIVIYNGYSTETMFTFDYQDTTFPNVCNTLGDGNLYYPAPQNLSACVNLPTTPIVIPPKHAMKIPISFSLPEDVEYPEFWEFQILIKDSKENSTVQLVRGVRVLVGMRQ